ncbi:hypothetical protein LXL04_023394 [Taraxacum kok-saghyz]
MAICAFPKRRVENGEVKQRNRKIEEYIKDDINRLSTRDWKKLHLPMFSFTKSSSSSRCSGLFFIWFKREQIMKTRTREQTWSLDQFKWHFCNSETTEPPHAPTGRGVRKNRNRINRPNRTIPPLDHCRTTAGPLPDHRRTIADMTLMSVQSHVIKPCCCSRHTDTDDGDANAD